MKKILFIAVLFVSITTAHAATYLERAAAIADALVDGTATAQQKTDVANAFVLHHRGEIIAAGLNPDTLTNEQKARVLVAALKRHIKTLVQLSDTGVAAAADSIEAAQTAAETAAEAAWPAEPLQ